MTHSMTYACKGFRVCLFLATCSTFASGISVNPRESFSSIPQRGSKIDHFYKTRSKPFLIRFILREYGFCERQNVLKIRHFWRILEDFGRIMHVIRMG